MSKGGPAGIFLIVMAVVLLIPGVIGIWLGKNGTVINNAVIHFGATATDEIIYGTLFVSIGITCLVIFLILFLFRRKALEAELPHYP
jgi:hypothetical protein